ncbi:elongation factor 1-alpha-like [Hibiscus syriacus]|uniref:Elongation factor 1-alpha-like n=1 Tax=Hibiscus syriacus TaxID=106335 RepID=A0A6A2XFZ6_HIBSY|nr:elongation factor 1-alpha-like [Hibiscus syriacus]
MSNPALPGYPYRFATRSVNQYAKPNIHSAVSIFGVQKRWASQAKTTEDENRISIGPQKGREYNEYEKDAGVVYYGPISSTIKKVKLLSLSTCCLSVSLGPVITFMTSPDMNVILKGAAASSVIFLSATTTAALHWFVSPYIHKIRWQPGSDSFEVEMLSWLATCIPRTIKFVDIRPPETNRPFVTFKANDNFNCTFKCQNINIMPLATLIKFVKPARGCNYVVHVNCALDNSYLYDTIEEESQCEELNAATQSSITRVIEVNEEEKPRRLNISAMKVKHTNTFSFLISNARSSSVMVVATAGIRMDGIRLSDYYHNPHHHDHLFLKKIEGYPECSHSDSAYFTVKRAEKSFAFRASIIVIRSWIELRLRYDVPRVAPDLLIARIDRRRLPLLARGFNRKIWFDMLRFGIWDLLRWSTTVITVATVEAEERRR